MTPNKEDYLKVIYELGERDIKMSNKMIAERMQVSAPAVSEMTKKMIQEEWITKVSGKGFKLTDKGMTLVTTLYRKHRLIEVFLINHLGYSPHEIHEEAEVLEHTVSDTFIDRLEKNLNFPKFCPHGGTIPQKGMKLIEINKTSLASLETLGNYYISRVHDHIDLLNYLQNHNLAIGTEFTLDQIDSYAKTYMISYLGKSLSIPENIAKEIYVTKK